MDTYEFVIRSRPVSTQTNDRRAYRSWSDLVAIHATRNSPMVPPFWEPVRLTMVHLYVNDTIDADNLIKPVQDALEGVFYPDDRLVTDVQSHRRSVLAEFDPVALPAPLATAWGGREECLYVRVQSASALENYL